MYFMHIFFLLTVPSPGKGGGLRQVDSRPKTFCQISNMNSTAKSNNAFYARSSPVSDPLVLAPCERELVSSLPHRGALQFCNPTAVKSFARVVDNSKQIQVNKKIHHMRSKIRLITWNLGTLTSKSRELVDIMKRRKINIACLQETKWKGDKAKEIGEGYKLYFIGKERNRNGVGIIVDNVLKDKVVQVRRISDRLMCEISFRG